MEKSFFIMLPDNKRVNLQGSSLEEVSRVFYKWPKDVQQEMSKGQLYMKDEKGNHIAVEFLNSPEKGKEEELVLPPLPPGLLKFWDKCLRPSLILMTLYLLGFWAVTTLVFLLSIPWLSKIVRNHYNTNRHPQEVSISMLWFMILSMVAVIVFLIAYNEGPIALPLGKEIVHLERNTVEQLPSYRLSCDSIVRGTQAVRYQDSLQISKELHLTGAWIFGYIKKDSIRHTYKVDRDSSLLTRVASSLESFCGDTVVSKKYKPYEDRNFSLVKVSKKYYDENYRLVDTIYYQNQSPKVGDWELEDIFKGTEAEWRHTLRVTKYTLAMLDGSKIDTLGTKEDAQSLLEAKCKDRATVDQRLVYAELDACLKNNKVQRIYVQEIFWCGYNPVRLSYTRGSVSSYPYRCNGSAGWTYRSF